MTLRNPRDIISIIETINLYNRISHTSMSLEIKFIIIHVQKNFIKRKIKILINLLTYFKTFRKRVLLK